MAAGILPEPGTKYGPCAEECEHTDCAETRTMAGAPCVVCEVAIGYDTSFYRVRDGRGHEPALYDARREPMYLAHARCVEV